MKELMIFFDCFLFAMSCVCFALSWCRGGSDIKKAILHLLFTNTVFIFSILIISLKVLG